MKSRTKNNSFLAGAVFLLLSISCPVFGQECPAGKSVVNMTTPSGRTHVVCIPDTAVAGLDQGNGASGITISGTCPCFEEEELRKLTSSETLNCEPPVFYERAVCPGDPDPNSLCKAVVEPIYLSSGWGAKVVDFEPYSSSYKPDGYWDYCTVWRDRYSPAVSYSINDKLDKMRCVDLLAMYCNTKQPQ
jgi:hypothetical protein